MHIDLDSYFQLKVYTLENEEYAYLPALSNSRIIY